MSATSAAAAAQSALQQVADPTIRQLAQADYAAHQSITRNDLLTIFSQVEQDHVISAAEFSSFSTLISHATAIGMPAYVANLANKVVNGNAANAYLATVASPTGNLFPGCPASQLKSLVADWFQGLGPVATTNSTAKMTWVSGVLFAKGGAKYTDIYQGVIGDCTLLASLAEVALRQPATIQNMFIDNGDGTLTVRLFHNGAPDYVTVDTQLPNGGQLYDRVTNGVLWAALAEKAMVEENASGWLGTWSPGSDSYAALNGGDEGTAVAYLSAITGLSSSAFGVNSSNIAGDWQANKFVLLSTGAAQPGSFLASYHCYAMVGYNAASNTPITLFNPWGITYGQPSVSASQLSTSFQFEAAAGAALEPSGHASSIPEPLQLTTAELATPSVVSASAASIPVHSEPTANTSTPSAGHDLANRSTRAIDEFFANWGSQGETLSIHDLGRNAA